MQMTMLMMTMMPRRSEPYSRALLAGDHCIFLFLRLDDMQCRHRRSMMQTMMMTTSLSTSASSALASPTSAPSSSSASSSASSSSSASASSQHHSENREPLSPWAHGDPRGRSHRREATITPRARRLAWPKPQSGSRYLELNLKLQIL